MKAVLFPDNKLNVTVEDIYNGYESIFTLCGEKLEGNIEKYIEILAHKYNIKPTMFFYENITDEYYIHFFKRFAQAMYFKMDMFWDIISNSYKAIPDYHNTVWTSSGANYFQNATVGQTKPKNYPNIGQEMYDISNGDYGYDYINKVTGNSNLEELKKAIEFQRSKHAYSRYGISALVYNYDANDYGVFLPYALSGTNRNVNKSGDGITNVKFDNTLSREDIINRSSNTRIYESSGGQSSTSSDWNTEINYAKQQIQHAIDNNGIYQDIMNWNKPYSDGNTQFLDLYFSELSNKIKNKNVWSAGYNEAWEYYFLREFVRNNCGVGSFELDGNIYIFIELFDKYKGNKYKGIDKEVDKQLFDTHLSLRLNTTGTELEGKDIVCNQSDSIRKINNNEFVINVKTDFNLKDYFTLEIIGVNSSEYYNNNLPTINYSVNNNKLTFDQECFVTIYYRNEGSNDIKDWTLTERQFRYPVKELYFNANSNLEYQICALNKYGKSKTKKIN